MITKEYLKEYRNRPEVRAQRKKYLDEYYKRPEVIERRRKYLKEYRSRPENKERDHEYQLRYSRTKERKASMAKYAKGEHKKEYTYFRGFYRYGITPEKYKQMLEAQGGHCACCPATEPKGGRLCIDHDHATGVVRGLLCHKCNMALGLVDDNFERLQALAGYALER